MIEVVPNIELRTVEVQVSFPGSISENSFNIAYVGDKISTVTYETGKVKTFTYNGDLLQSISSLYEGVTILKTFLYDSNDTLTGVEVTYS